jgi:hypothetical protein
MRFVVALRSFWRGTAFVSLSLLRCDHIPQVPREHEARPRVLVSGSRSQATAGTLQVIFGFMSREREREREI